jgi:hypothetical protein
MRISAMKIIPAMNDTVADRFDCLLALVLPNPSEKLVRKVFVCELGAILAKIPFWRYYHH